MKLCAIIILKGDDYDMFNKLLKYSCKSFSVNDCQNKSSALIITDKGDEIFGVGIYLTTEKVSPISNAICNAVSDGYIKFTDIYVYINSKELQNSILDNMAISLLKEFKISEIKLFVQSEKMHIIKIY